MKSGPFLCSAFGGGESNAEGKELIEMEKQRVWRRQFSWVHLQHTDQGGSRHKAGLILGYRGAGRHRDWILDKPLRKSGKLWSWQV